MFNVEYLSIIFSQRSIIIQIVSITKFFATMPSQKRGLRIAGCSGGFTDRQRNILSMAKCDVDVIIGDWMSECK